MKKLENDKLTLIPEGRLDSTTAKQLEEAIVPDGVMELVLDLAGLSYISSAGLRVIINAQKQMNARKGYMVLKNVNELNMEILETVGFADILNIENE